MASPLKINTLTGVTTAGSIAVTGEGNSTTTNLQQGLAKAFIIANQVTESDSFNASGTTDHGTGTYTYSFTNDFSSTNFMVSHSAGKKGETFGIYLEQVDQRAAGSVKFEIYDIGNSITDGSNIQQVYFGDLA